MKRTTRNTMIRALIDLTQGERDTLRDEWGIEVDHTSLDSVLGPLKEECSRAWEPRPEEGRVIAPPDVYRRAKNGRQMAKEVNKRRKRNRNKKTHRTKRK